MTKCDPAGTALSCKAQNTDRWARESTCAAREITWVHRENIKQPFRNHAKTGKLTKFESQLHWPKPVSRSNTINLPFGQGPRVYSCNLWNLDLILQWSRPIMLENGRFKRRFLVDFGQCNSIISVCLGRFRLTLVSFGSTLSNATLASISDGLDQF